MISTVLRLLYDLLSLKNDVYVPSKRNKHRNFFFVGIDGHFKDLHIFVFIPQVDGAEPLNNEEILQLGTDSESSGFPWRLG